MSHPALGLRDIVHQRVRLAILSVLAEAKRADFVYLRDEIGLTDGNLSRNLQVLEDAGLVEIEKTFEAKRPRTWVRATRKGKAALRDEMRVMRDLLEAYERSIPSASPI